MEVMRVENNLPKSDESVEDRRSLKLEIRCGSPSFVCSAHCARCRDPLAPVYTLANTVIYSALTRAFHTGRGEGRARTSCSGGPRGTAAAPGFPFSAPSDTKGGGGGD